MSVAGVAEGHDCQLVDGNSDSKGVEQFLEATGLYLNNVPSQNVEAANGQRMDTGGPAVWKNLPVTCAMNRDYSMFN